MVTPPFNELKATQAAAFLLRENNGRLSYMKLIKLLYNANRLSMERKGKPIYFDRLFSMPHGQVPSETLNRAKEDSSEDSQIWDQYICKDDYECILVNGRDCGIGKLSRSEIQFLKEIDQKYKNWTQFEMEDEHHNPNRFPEWVDVNKLPDRNREDTDYARLLKILGYSDSRIEELQQEYLEIAILDTP